MRQKRLKTILLPVLLFLSLFVFLALFDFLIHTDPVQRYLLGQLSRAIGYELHAETVTFSFSHGIGIRARNFSVSTPGGNEKAGASRIRMDFDLGELLKGRVVPTELVILDPKIHLAAQKNRGFSFQGKKPVLEKSHMEILAAFPLVSLENAHVVLEKAGLTLKKLNIRLTRKSKHPILLDVSMAGTAFYNGAMAPFSGKGVISEDAETGLFVDGRFHMKEIPLARLPLPDDLQVKRGSAEINVAVKGFSDGTLTLDGKLVFREPAFLLVDGGDKKAFDFDCLTIPFNAAYVDSVLKIPFFQIQNTAFTLKGASTFDFTTPGESHLDLMVESPFMTLAAFKRIFPSSLLPSWLETRIFPIFSGGNVRVDLFSLNGPWRRLENLDLQENADLLRLQLTCNGFTAFNDEPGLQVDRVSGNLEIRKGEIHVSQVNGRFGQSRIDSGSLFLKDLYVDDPYVRVMVGGSFRVEDLLARARLKLIPPEVRAKILEIEGAAGKLDGKVNIVYEPEWHFPKMETGVIMFSDGALNDPNIPFPVLIKEGTLKITPEGGTFVAEGQWGKSRLSASGNLGADWQTGEAHLVAMADMEELLGHFYPDLQTSMAFKNRIPCQVSLSKKKNWTFHGALDLKQALLETESMTIDPFGNEGGILFSGIVVPEKQFTLRNLQCNLGQSSFALSGAYDLANRDAFNFNVSSKKLRLEDLGIRFKKGNFSAKGDLKCKISATASRQNPSNTRLTGRMEGQALSFATRAFPHPITDCNFQLNFAGKDVFIESLALKLGKSPIHLKGEFQGWDGMTGEMIVRSEFLDLNDLIPEEMAEKFEKGNFERVLKNIGKGVNVGSVKMEPGWKKGAHHFVETSDVHFNITAPRVRWEEAEFGPLKIECALRSKDLYINRSSLRFERGKLLLRGHVKRGEKPETLFTSYLEMVQQPLEDLPSPLAFVKSRLEGKLTMESLLFARGNTTEDLLSSFTGSANVLLEQGVVRKSNVFIKILDDMSLTRVFETRPENLSKDGLYFHRIEGRMDIEKGIVKADNLAMESPVFNALAEGWADLRTGMINAEIGVHPLVTADLLVSKIPILGYLLRGDDNTVAAEYFQVDGKMSDPDVRYMTFKSMSNGTYSFFKRLFLSPQRLFQNISEAAGDFEQKGLLLPDESLQPEYDMAK